MVMWIPLMPPPARSRFFVSYRSLEREAAAALEQRLIVGGHEVWRDRGKIHTGDDWRAEIRLGISDCDDVIVLLTPQAAKSEQVLYEIETAIEFQKRLRCFATLDLRDVPSLYQIMRHVHWDRVPHDTDWLVHQCPSQFAEFIADRLFSPVTKPHPLDLRDFERAAARNIYPPFSEIWRHTLVDRALIEQYSAYANHLVDDAARCNSTLALNAGLLASHLEEWEHAYKCFDRSLQLSKSDISFYFYALATLQSIRPRHLTARALDKGIGLASEAWTRRQSPLIALLLVTLLWDSGKGRGKNLENLFLEAIRNLPIIETTRDEVARFRVLMPLERDVQLPVGTSEFSRFLFSLF
jgi:tetratricopeptide (TPR) repeat protein